MYRGIMLTWWGRFTFLACCLTILACVLGYVESDKIWKDGWLHFWRVRDTLAWGVVVSLCPATLIWLVIPAACLAGGLGIEGYVRYRVADRVRWVVLAITSGTATVVTLAIGPALTTLFFRTAWNDAAAGLLTGSGLLSLGGFVWRFVRLTQQRVAAAELAILRFPDDLRPQNTRVINLDCGALAPRLNVVAEGLETWSRVVNGSAPTAHVWWNAVSESREALPAEWQRSLRGRAWTGIEDFRRLIAELIQVERGSVIFVNSTTRACSVALQALVQCDAIVTTNMEHPSEERLFEMQANRRGIKIIRVDSFGLLEAGRLYEALPDAMALACAEYHCPAVVISEVPYSVGIRLPVTELTRKIRAACPGALIIVDGAHAVGHMPVNVGSIDPDFYVFSGHKWLFGPATLGVLVIGARTRSTQTLYDRVVAECYESLAVEGRRIGESGSTVALEPFVGLAEFIAAIGRGAMRDQIEKNLWGIRGYLEKAVTNTSSFAVIRFSNVRAESIAPGTINVQGQPYKLSEENLHHVRDVLEEKHQVIAKVVSKPLSLRLCVPYYLGLAECERVVKALENSFGGVIPRSVNATTRASRVQSSAASAH